MPASRSLQQTLNWASGFFSFQPFLIGGQEPALTCANLVLQTILGAPFCWAWNRGQVQFNCVNAQQDYAQFIPDFGFLEKAWVRDAAADLKEIEIRNALSSSIEAGRPGFIAAQLDDNAGNITLRNMPVPDKAYVQTVLYQKKAPIMTSIANTWSPIPDEKQFIYEYGFLAMCAVFAEDPRFPIFNQRFLSHLLGAQEGLDEMKRNIFLGNWLLITSAASAAQLKTQQGIAARQL